LWWRPAGAILRPITYFKGGDVARIILLFFILSLVGCASASESADSDLRRGSFPVDHVEKEKTATPPDESAVPQPPGVGPTHTERPDRMEGSFASGDNHPVEVLGLLGDLKGEVGKYSEDFGVEAGEEAGTPAAPTCADRCDSAEKVCELSDKICLLSAGSEPCPEATQHCEDSKAACNQCK
jgi:hypothetical protein